MYAGKLVFAQLTDLIHPEQFGRCVRRYHGDYKIKTFSCWSQFLCMAFGQLTFRFLAGSRVAMVDSSGTSEGTWSQKGNQLTLRFNSGRVVYTGTLNGAAQTIWPTDCVSARILLSPSTTP